MTTPTQNTLPTSDNVPHAPVINTTNPPKWCKQLITWPSDCKGAKGSEIFDGCEIALEAFGEQVKEKNSSLLAMAYLYRRFGPPAMGTDEYKKLCSYVLGTPMRGVYLNMDLSGSSLQYSVGYVAKQNVLNEHYESIQHDWIAMRERFAAWYRQQSDREQTEVAMDNAFYDRAAMDASKALEGNPRRKSREELRNEDGVIKQMNDAIVDCLRELLRPVYIQDAAINLFGRLTDEEAGLFKYHADYFSTEEEE